MFALTCFAALVLAGCRSGPQPTLGPLLTEPERPKLVRLAHGFAAQWAAGGRIVYLDPRDGDVWSIRPTGKARQRLVATKRRVGLLVSPNRIRMLLLRAGENGVARIDGRRLRPIPTLARASMARWSDDGSMITFQRSSEGRSSIWAVPPRGGEPQRLFGEFGGRVLAWSPDGRMVVRAFRAERGGSFSATVLFGAEGEALEIPHLLEARFLPDGTVEGIEEEGTLVRLDDLGRIVRRFPGLEPIRDLPSYSEDGSLMVYEQGGQLWIAGADWTSPRLLVSAPCYRPSFSPDGSRVACSLIVGEGRKQTRHVAVVGVPAELR